MNTTPIDLNALMLTFNRMYGMPAPRWPTLNELGVAPMTRIADFQHVLSKELSEGNAIHDAVKGVWMSPEGRQEWDLDILTDLADWLGDMIVYCASEATKYGIPIAEVLGIIMESNASKLQADGTAKFDEYGHLEKGPNYWKPEPRIRALLAQRLANVGLATGEAQQDGGQAQSGACVGLSERWTQTR